jgi:surface antigen
MYFRHCTQKNIFAVNLNKYSASFTMGTGGSFPGGKARPGRDADHSPPSSAEVKGE